MERPFPKIFLLFQVTPCLFSFSSHLPRDTLVTSFMVLQLCKHLFSCRRKCGWCEICPVWNPRRLFNGRLALTHHRDQARHVFYDLVNEQRCCETCVCLPLRRGAEGVGGWCLIGIYLPHTQTLHPFCLDCRVLPRELCWTGRNPQISRDCPISLTQNRSGQLPQGCLSFTSYKPITAAKMIT